MVALGRRALALPLRADVADSLGKAGKTLADLAGKAGAPVAADAPATEIGKRADDLGRAMAETQTAAETALQGCAGDLRAKRKREEFADYDKAASLEGRIAIREKLAAEKDEAEKDEFRVESYDAPAPKPAAAPASPAAAVVLDAPPFASYNLSSRRSVAQIRNEIRFNEWATNWTVLAVTSFVGVVALSSNET